MKLTKDVLERQIVSLSNSQLIFVTNSPDIIDKYEDCIYPYGLNGNEKYDISKRELKL